VSSSWFRPSTDFDGARVEFRFSFGMFVRPELII